MRKSGAVPAALVELCARPRCRCPRRSRRPRRRGAPAPRPRRRERPSDPVAALGLRRRTESRARRACRRCTRRGRGLRCRRTRSRRRAASLRATSMNASPAQLLEHLRALELPGLVGRAHGDEPVRQRRDVVHQLLPERADEVDVGGVERLDGEVVRHVSSVDACAEPIARTRAGAARRRMRTRPGRERPGPVRDTSGAAAYRMTSRAAVILTCALPAMSVATTR